MKRDMLSLELELDIGDVKRLEALRLKRGFHDAGDSYSELLRSLVINAYINEVDCVEVKAKEDEDHKTVSLDIIPVKKEGAGEEEEDLEEEGEGCVER